MFDHWRDAINLLSGAKVRQSRRLGERLDQSTPLRRATETQELHIRREACKDCPGENDAAPNAAP